MKNPAARKLLVIGIDQAIPELINRYVKDGLLPNIAHMIKQGVYGRGLSSPPCDTPTNWTTIATGVSSAKHSATSFYLHIPEESFESSFSQRSRTQLSQYCTATHFWNFAEKAGYTPFILNYPSGWPADFEHGVMSLYTWPIPESLPRILYGKKTHNFTLESLELISQKQIESFSASDNINIHNQEQARVGRITIPLHISLALQDEHKDENQVKEDEENGKIEKTHVINQDVHLLDFALIPSESSGISSHSSPQRFYYKTSSRNKWTELTEAKDSDWITLSIITEKFNFHCLFRINYTLDFAQNSSSPFCNVNCSPVYNTSGWTVPAEFGEKLVRNALIPEMVPRKTVEYMVATGI